MTNQRAGSLTSYSLPSAFNLRRCHQHKAVTWPILHIRLHFHSNVLPTCVRVQIHMWKTLGLIMKVHFFLWPLSGEIVRELCQLFSFTIAYLSAARDICHLLSYFFLSIYTHTRLVALQIIFSCKMRKLILLCVFNFLFACKQFHLSVKHINKVIQNVGCKVFGCKTWQNVRSCNLIDPWTLLSFEFDHDVCSV